MDRAYDSVPAFCSCGILVFSEVIDEQAKCCTERYSWVLNCWSRLSSRLIFISSSPLCFWQIKEERTSLCLLWNWDIDCLMIHSRDWLHKCLGNNIIFLKIYKLGHGKLFQCLKRLCIRYCNQLSKNNDIQYNFFL